MPKIEVPEKLFFELCGRTYTDDEMNDIFPVAKAELDGHEDGTVKIELNDTNRPDLWSVAGVARALKTYETGVVPQYDFFSSKDRTMDSADRVHIDYDSCLGIRDFSISFAAEGCTVTEELLVNLIQSQEKLCQNFGRKRKTIAIGIFRSDLITYPIHYIGADPDKTSFVPLGMTEKLTLREILEKHPKGREYGAIISDKPRYPYLYDDKGETLSFSPIINSAHSGAVEVGDRNLFIDISGPILDDLLLAASILACDMADMGFRILPVKVKLAKDTKYGREITVPYRFQQDATCPVDFVEKELGERLSDQQCIDALRRMGVQASVKDGVITARCPEYRNDFLHAVDIVEDIMIGHGLSNFAPVLPAEFTKGSLSKAEEYSRKVKTLMVGMGFQEMMYNYLGSRKEYVDNMHIGDDKVVFIANPMSENYEVVRPSILPSLLESESVSGHAVYPHRIFELGKVCFKDDADNSGTVTRNSLGFLAADNQIGFNEASSYVNTLMYFLRIDYRLQPVEDDGRYIPGRAARVMCGDVEIGTYGEVHPQVLESWGCSMPAIMAEFDLDLMH